MNDPPPTCPHCGSTAIRFRANRDDWFCDACDQRWTVAPAGEPSRMHKARLFLSYGRRDAATLADRLEHDLAALGYEVWRDTRRIRSGKEWEQEIEDGLRSTQIVVALLSPHAVRKVGSPGGPDDLDSVCLDELSFARFACRSPIVPVMAVMCEPPFVVFRLDYIDLSTWSDSEDQYRAGFARLERAVVAGLRGEVRYRSWDDRLKPWDFAAFLHEKRRDFSGRDWLFDQIDAWRLQRQERALLITGDPGVGKSAIVAELVHRNPGGQVLAYHCCQATTPETLRPDRFVRSVAAMVASQLESYAARLAEPKIEEALSESSCQSDPLSAFEAGLLAPLETLPAPPEGVRYLLVDALDEALAHRASLTIVDVLASRLNRLPGWLRLVATSRREPDVLDRLRGLRAWALHAQDPRNLEDIALFLTHRLDQPDLAERLVQSRVSAADALARLRDRSGGNFLWVQQALQGIERDEYGFDRLDALPPGLHGLYSDFFQRHFPDDTSYAPARRVLEVVVAAAEPLTANQIAEAAGLDPEYELPRVLGLLAAYLPERQGRFVVYHKSFADWLTAPETRRRTGRNYSVSPRLGHERLAEWCWRDYQRSPGSLSAYTLDHLPAHLVLAARWDDLAAVLTDLLYLETKTEAGRVFDLARDFTRAVAGIPEAHASHRRLRLLEQALRYDIHFLVRHPACLFQCLWNRCWWYDTPLAAAHYDPPRHGWPDDGPPWTRPERERLSNLLEAWRAEKERRTPSFLWLRALRPPAMMLGTGLRAVFTGHEHGVLSVAFDPDGRRIASGSADMTVRVWDADSGSQIACFQGHGTGVASVAFDPGGRRIASGLADKTVRVWDADTGTELFCLRGHADTVGCAVFDPSGRTIASASADNTVRLWNAETGTELACFRGHEESVVSVRFDPAGRRIVSGSEDRTVRVWDVETGAQLACFRGHEYEVLSVAFDPDGGRIASASFDMTVRVWDAATGAQLACLRGHESHVTSVTFDRDGRRIISGSWDKTVRIWDAATGLELGCLRGHEFEVWSVAIAPDGRRIASGSWDRSICIWDADAGAETARLHGHDAKITSVAFNATGRCVGSGSKDKTLRVWDGATGSQRLCLHGHDNSVTGVSFDRDGGRIASSSEDHTVRVWDTGTGRELVCLRGQNSYVTCVAFDHDGRRIASGSEDDAIRVWNSETGAEVACLRGHEHWVTCVAFDRQGRRIVSGSYDKTVRIWDIESGIAIACLRGHEHCITHVAFDRDGVRIASASKDETVRIWDAETGRCLEILQGKTDVAACAQGPSVFAWRAMARTLETHVEPASGGAPIAWFPAAIDQITTHPSGRTWAGNASTYLCLIALEGAPE